MPRKSVSRETFSLPSFTQSHPLAICARVPKLLDINLVSENTPRNILSGKAMAEKGEYFSLYGGGILGS